MGLSQFAGVFFTSSVPLQDFFSGQIPGTTLFFLGGWGKIFYGNINRYNLDAWKNSNNYFSTFRQSFCFPGNSIFPAT